MDQKHMLTRLFDSETHFIISHLTRRLKWHTQIHTDIFNSPICPVCYIFPFTTSLHFAHSSFHFNSTFIFDLFSLCSSLFTIQQQSNWPLFPSPSNVFVYCILWLTIVWIIPSFALCLLFAFPSLPGKTLSNK